MAKYSSNDLQAFKNDLIADLQQTRSMTAERRVARFVTLYTRRNTLLSIYLLNKMHGNDIVQPQLEKLLNHSDLPDLLDAWDKFIEHRGTTPDGMPLIRFVPEFYSAIGEVYDMPEFGFRLSNHISYFENGSTLGGRHFNEITGLLFLIWMNQLNESYQITKTDITQLIMRAFMNVAPGHIVAELQTSDNGIPVAIIRSLTDAWCFLLTAHPMEGLISMNAATQAMLGLIEVRDELQFNKPIKMLLVAPTISTTELTDLLRSFPNIYYMWSFSIPKFFNLLDEELAPHCTSDELAAIFDSFLPPAPKGLFSVDEAIQRLKDKKKL